MCSPSWTLLPPPSPHHPSGTSQCTSPKHPVSCIEPGLATHFIHDITHVSMPFPNLPTFSLSNRIHKTVLYISVSLAVWGMWGVGSMTRAQTHTSCIGRWSLDDWTAREVPDPVFKSHRTLCLAPLLKKTPVTSFYWGNSCVKLLLLFCEALGLEHQLWELCCSWQYVLLYKGNLTWTPNWS